MPHNGAENIPHVAWTDHRILRRPNRTPKAQSNSTGVLKAIFSPEANARDLGMAYYLAYLKGNGAEGARAWSLLNSERQKIQSDQDKPALDALALLSIERGDTKTGESLFQELLRIDPDDLTANSDLGVLMAKQGNSSESLRLLQSAFSRNQDVAGLAMNLARVQCARGDAAGVRSTLTTALVYNPGVRELQQFLQSADACRAPAGSGTTR
jgi:Flp pilus assembly protein TadD